MDNIEEADQKNNFATPEPSSGNEGKGFCLLVKETYFHFFNKSKDNDQIILQEKHIFSGREVGDSSCHVKNGRKRNGSCLVILGVKTNKTPPSLQLSVRYAGKWLLGFSE